MNEYMAKLASLTAEQSKALAEAMNANYSRSPVDDSDDKQNDDRSDGQDKSKSKK